MKEVSVKNLDVNYKKEGKGEPLLILHGWESCSEKWKEVQDELCSEFDVIIPDLPGFGESESPSGSWTVEDYLEFVRKFVQQLDLDSFYLVGHSFGGSLSVKVTVTHPELVRKVVLIDSAGIKPKPTFKAKMMKCLAEKGKLMFKGPLSKFEGKARSAFYKLLRNTDYGKADEVMKETMNNVFDYYSKLDSGSGEFLSDLKKLKKETLLVWGEQDKIIPLSYGERFKKEIDNSELKVIPQVGHSPHLKSPSKTASIISEFFDQK